MAALISLITVNFNGYIDTIDLIESLASIETYRPYELIVVDNGSQGPDIDNLKEIQKTHPEVKLIRNHNNGFAGGNNKGLEYAAGDYLFFINNDTLIKSPILQTMVDRLDNDSCNGGVSPMIKYASQPDTLQYAGFTAMTPITLRNDAIGFQQKESSQYQVARPTAFLHGAAMMVPRKVIEKVGPMSEVFFLFYEELDWSTRLTEAGYRLWYEPKAVVYHKECMTAKKSSPLREFYLSRARVMYARRNVKGFDKMLSCLYILLLAAPKKSVSHFIHRDFKLGLASMKGAICGLFANIHP